MPIYNGISYPETDFLDYGYKTPVTSGTGVSLPRWQAALCDAIADAGKQMRGTSVTSNNITTGTLTFVLDNDLPFGANEPVQIYSTVNRANSMYGTVTSYTQATKTLIVSIAGVNGSGSALTSWAINSSGVQGVMGSAGASFDISALTSDTWANIVNLTFSSGAGTAGNKKISKANYLAGLAADSTFNSALFGSQHIWCPAGFIFPSTTGGCANVATIATSANQPDIKSLDFDTTTQEFAQFSIRMPEQWDEGTVTAMFVWSHAATTTNFGVVFNLQGVAERDNTAIATAYGTAQLIADTGGTTNNLYVTASTPAITLAGSPAAGDVVHFRVARVPADASDTIAIDARLHGVILGVTTVKGNDS